MTAIALRPATAGDAPAIARVRIESWRATYRGMIPDAYLDGMQVDASTAIWDRVLTRGPRHHQRLRRRARRTRSSASRAAAMLAEPKFESMPSSSRSICGASTSTSDSGGGSSAPSSRRRATTGATGLLTWVIAGNKAARAFYERLGGELLVEQPFQWDGMDLVEAGYGWRDLAALAEACRDEAFAAKP